MELKYVYPLHSQSRYCCRIAVGSSVVACVEGDEHSTQLAVFLPTPRLKKCNTIPSYRHRGDSAIPERLS